MSPTSPPRRVTRALVATTTGLLALGLAGPLAPARAYTPTPGVMYTLPSDTPCLKGRGNCAVYPKAAQLPNGRLVAGFELSTVQASGSAVGQTIPIYVSDDTGDSWKHLTDVKPPAEMSDDPAVAKYTSNWTNPYFYVMPETVGDLKKNTLLMASVVSGDDEYYLERKKADPTWTPDNDGDRKDVAIALYASIDNGNHWRFVNIVTEGGWQGGSAGAPGRNVATANTHRQLDPVWEPYLMVYRGRLVAYYSDENEYSGYDRATGRPTPSPVNDTAADPNTQILAHRTWDGTGRWSAPVLDVSGSSFEQGGQQYIGGGRPGMTNVVQTADGRWMMTFEYWGLPWWQANNRFKLADSPLEFFRDGDPDGLPVSDIDDAVQEPLKHAAGSRGLAWGGNPVLVRLPDGRIVYNAGGDPDLWLNPTGDMDDPWTQMHTDVPGGYSRNITYERKSGRLLLLQAGWGGADANSVVRFGHVDVGHSTARYTQVTNRATGQVIGTGGNWTDAQFGNAWTPDVRLEKPGATDVPDTQYWSVVTKDDGNVTLLNRAGGRAAAIWGDTPSEGVRIASWADNVEKGLWTVVRTDGGYVQLRSAGDPSLYVTADADHRFLTLEKERTDGSQEWLLGNGVAPRPGASGR
ncbi:RICIN domain-containing protein [Phycicoccus flavus]|uniref:RICIN domain-containing protein n=1 Tax=Phycicoccus flavus TaxID=2502783 RepID=UPI000FEB768E|nr:RICIN domain-containing protein [Phycicoccus flavus]NHA66453.1 RICIN domain-containing protein [Phycicoccus flavus]